MEEVFKATKGREKRRNQTQDPRKPFGNKF